MSQDITTLAKLRKRIDRLDGKLLEILARRMALVAKIGIIKKSQGIKPHDEKRWQEILSTVLTKAQSLNLPVSFIKKLYENIHAYSKKIEQSVQR